jgi:2-keto-4-pentenoate hydratase/2-oxohepta-3-ene-1,7-dioic acid hydratase in catechol pathway
MGQTLKWVRFRLENQISYGLLEEDSVIAVKGSPLEAYQLTSKSYKTSEVQLLTPIQPSMLYFAGPNFKGHIEAMAARRGQSPVYPVRPDPHFRSVHALIPSHYPIVIPADSCQRLQPEGQLAVVIGKMTKNVPVEKALDHVLGYSLANDVTEREWQKSDRTMFRSKNTDTFKPFGPCIATQLDPLNIRIEVRHNGQVIADFSSSEQIWSIAYWIHILSQNTTLHPGDCIMMGTQGAAGDMVAGDVIEVFCKDIGLLSNRLIQEIDTKTLSSSP